MPSVGVRRGRTRIKPKTEHHDTVTLGLIQTQAGNNTKKNLDHTLQKIEVAARKGAQIICLQELFCSLYFPQTEDVDFFQLAETIPGPTTQKLSKLARQKKIVIIASLFEKRSAGLYHNTAVVIDADGAILGIYRKMHIPDDPCFYEKFYFTPGDTGFKVFDTRFGRVGVLVCWDQWFPEAARLTALKGAQILFYPTAIGAHDKDRAFAQTQHQAWETIQRSHAIANGVYVASVNRLGRENDLTFWGGSFVSDPFGKMLAKGSSNKEEILIVPCNLKKIEETRHGWPFLRDRRIDAYHPLTERYIDSFEL
ncbi:MAG: carbon-nitrogen hydrolase [Chlamydiae bacterium]|nr:carbon-nitrogen hydrolase [Chlamydiota bacterium]